MICHNQPVFGQFQAQNDGGVWVTREALFVIAFLHRRTSFRCGVHHEIVEARTTDQRVICNSIRRHHDLTGLTYCQNILDSRQFF